jgi:hypothetical protein
MVTTFHSSWTASRLANERSHRPNPAIERTNMSGSRPDSGQIQIKPVAKRFTTVQRCRSNFMHKTPEFGLIAYGSMQTNPSDW